MPYHPSKPPKKTHTLKPKGRRQWVHVFNSSLKQGDSEQVAHQKAWAAVRKSGNRKRDDKDVEKAAGWLQSASDWVRGGVRDAYNSTVLGEEPEKKYWAPPPRDRPSSNKPAEMLAWARRHMIKNKENVGAIADEENPGRYREWLTKQMRIAEDQKRFNSESDQWVSAHPNASNIDNSGAPIRRTQTPPHPQMHAQTRRSSRSRSHNRPWSAQHRPQPAQRATRTSNRRPNWRYAGDPVAIKKSSLNRVDFVETALQLLKSAGPISNPPAISAEPTSTTPGSNTALGSLGSIWTKLKPFLPYLGVTAGGLGLLSTFLSKDKDKSLSSYLPWLALGGLGGYGAYKGYGKL